MRVKLWFNLLPLNIPVQSVPMVLKKLVTKAKQLFNLSLQSTPVQSVAILQVLMERRKLVTRVKHGSNLLIQSTLDRSVPMVPKK